MHYRVFTTLLVAICGALIALTPGRAAADSRVVVELFTSQGCSSCPAADKLLGELAKDPTILPISLSVDYWDYLGWKDTLALPGHSKRQRAYAGLRGDRAVYTPQAVINGVTHVLGNDKAAIERAVSTARKSAAIALPVNVAIANGKVTVDVAAAKVPGQSGEVWLCPIKRQVPVQIGRGENRGHTVTYTNVVRGWVKLGNWNGDALQFTKSVSDVVKSGIDVDAMVAVVQAGKFEAPGNVLGGGAAELR
ncbi:DUF1223 domain-containing protein [Pseudorhodoplanes sinuspersici]|uniref:DUF1223 domain-containing protein n=1 Tax=Pseudorhodoplanes sinuspersici TaxID=1235591 RepID=A0A1W6ZNK7_9HYPH|nr:DUF1223 domain-containing protein [Pseudorhodoplanes sinuspersici]ARP98949.1 hypothetical protein CAK95_07540 [Pseudorhodoplanes sinuspersici]